MLADRTSECTGMHMCRRWVELACNAREWAVLHGMMTERLGGSGPAPKHAWLAFSRI